MKNQNAPKLTIGHVAKSAGVGVETVRFYERKGLIRQPKKATGGFRTYAADDPVKIRFIKRAQDLGFTLREIKELLDLNANTRVTCGHVSRRAEIKIEEIKKKIEDLKRMQQSLEELRDACAVGKEAVADCKVMDCFEDGCANPGTAERRC